MSRCLQFDVGNSRAKWRLVEQEGVVDRNTLVHGDSRDLERLMTCADTVDQIWIASVAGPQVEQELSAVLRERWGVEPWFARSPAAFGGLVNSYSEPLRMGVDRWLAMLGARLRCKQRLCVIDAGSALTIDLVSAEGQHEGGYIIPGPALMERALLLDTGRVRFEEDVGYSLSPGKSTAEAVRHGIALAQAGAVKLALDHAGGDVPTLYFCGGAGQSVQQLLQAEGQYVPDLVFDGLVNMAVEQASGD